MLTLFQCFYLQLQQILQDSNSLLVCLFNILFSTTIYMKVFLGGHHLYMYFCVFVRLCDFRPEVHYHIRDGCRGLNLCVYNQWCLTRWKIVKINFGVTKMGGHTKIIFNQFSHHYMQFWTTFFFFSNFDKIIF